MNKKLVGFIGSGGHSRSVMNIIDRNLYEILGIYDNSFDPSLKEEILGVQIIGTLDHIPGTIKLVLSVGNNVYRKELFYKFNNMILDENLIHRSSISENQVQIGKSNQIFANTYINSESKVGDNNIINTGCILEHEAQIGSHNHISVGSILCGRVIVGDECFIGAGSVIVDNIKICNSVIIGANSTVIRDITEPGIYVGNPVNKIK